MRLVSKRPKPAYPDINMASARLWADGFARFRRFDTLDEMLEVARYVMPGMPFELREKLIREQVAAHTMEGVPDVYRCIRTLYNTGRKVTVPLLHKSLPSYRPAEISRILAYLTENPNDDESPIPEAYADLRESEQQRPQSPQRTEAGKEVSDTGRRPTGSTIRRGPRQR